MFQNLFDLHRELPFEQILLHERQIAQSFQHRPRLLPNIEKLRCSTSTVSLAAPVIPFSFSNRPEIESNEIDLTKLIRDTYANRG